MAAPIGNRFAVGNNGGRPPLYKTVPEMEQGIKEYFTFMQGEYKEIEKKEGVGESARVVLDEFGESVMIRKWIRQPQTITLVGLALWLGFASRNSFLDTAKRGEEFSDLLTWAKSLVEMDYESRLAERDKTHGAQFALMNMGWAANTRHGMVGKDGEVVDPPKQQVMIINGKEIAF